MIDFILEVLCLLVEIPFDAWRDKIASRFSKYRKKK